MKFVEFHKDDTDSSNCEVTRIFSPLLDNSYSDSDDVHRIINRVLDSYNSDNENICLLLNNRDSNSDEYEENLEDDVSWNTKEISDSEMKSFAPQGLAVLGRGDFSKTKADIILRWCKYIYIYQHKPKLD